MPEYCLIPAIIRHASGERGITLIELMVASAVGLVVVAAVFAVVTYAGIGTQRLKSVQQLQQESALVSEVFMRTVRNGNFVCVGNATAAPTADAAAVAAITIRGKDSSVVAEFGIDNDSLEMNGNRYLTAYLCRFRTPASHFTVFQNGKHVAFYLSMFKAQGGDTTYYTQTIGDVRCKN
jgi:Tfp pilus assembly protein PilW